MSNKATTNTKRTRAPKTGMLEGVAWKTENLTTSARIVNELKENITLSLLNNELKPGDYLGNEHDIAQAFNTSRHPVRDALRTLQGLGLLDIRVGNTGGIFVAEPNLDRFEDALAIQMFLMGVSDSDLFGIWPTMEAMSAEQAAKKKGGKNIAELEQMVAQMENLLDDKKAFIEQGMELHLGIAEATENNMLCVQMNVIWRCAHEKFWFFPFDEYGAEITKRLKKIVKYIKDGDVQNAKTHMYNHFQVVNEIGKELFAKKD